MWNTIRRWYSFSLATQSQCATMKSKMLITLLLALLVLFSVGDRFIRLKMLNACQRWKLSISKSDPSCISLCGSVYEKYNTQIIYNTQKIFHTESKNLHCIDLTLLYLFSGKQGKPSANNETFVYVDTLGWWEQQAPAQWRVPRVYRGKGTAAE